MPKKPDRITIVGKRWFSRSCGNTYHSVEVYANDELIERAPFVYGYGDQYLQSAHRILQKAEYYSNTNNNLVDYSEFLDDMRDRENTPYIAVFCCDVARKKDL